MHGKTLRVVWLAFMVGWSAACAQDARVVIVRDDDGTKEDQRGHVSNPQTYLKKVLAVEHGPEEIRSARVMYLMKINPYHVGTRQLRGGPAEGVEWNNLIIRVNDQEVLRESMIAHATAGWHEVEVPPDALRLGDNDVTFGMDKAGGYFYMAVDSSSPLGRSAVSTDGGRTFQSGNVSPGAKAAVPGEFMVRLKLEVAAAGRPQIEMRGGHGYGWLEVEDLFSRTRRHEGGWQAITWTRGENLPSRGLTVHTQQNSAFSYAFELPKAGPWFVWVRGWEDGHYQGHFALAWDDKEFFDSQGKIEFSSDSKLRFEWLKAGPTELDAGPHTLTYTVTGACGHMADVIVLTTDPDFVPDETAPLRRMPVPEKLVPPEGLTDMTPGLFHDEPPLPWATPLAGERLRTLWICGNTQAREVQEISRRLDMTMDVVTYTTTYLGRNVFGGNLNLGQGDLIYELASSAKPYDVAVLVRVKFDQIPEHAWKPLLDRVEQGMGLVIVESHRGGDPPSRLAEARKAPGPLHFPALQSPINLGRLTSNRRARLGRGRVVTVGYTLFGMMDRIGQDSTAIPYSWWEYHFARWIKLLLTGAGRQEGQPQIEALDVPQAVAPGTKANATVKLRGREAAPCRTRLVTVTYKPGSSSPVGGAGGGAGEGRSRTVALPPGGIALEIPLHTTAEGGTYRTVMRLLDDEDRVLDFASAHFDVKPPLALTGLGLPAEPIEPGGTLPVTCSLANAHDTAKAARVEVRVHGAHRRLLAEQGFEENIVPGENEITREVRLLPDAGMWARAEVRLLDEEGVVLGRADGRVLVRQPVVHDDVHLHTSAFDNKEVPEYLQPIYVRLWHQIGADLLHPSDYWTSGNEFGMRCALSFRMTHSGHPSIDEDGVRDPCFHDPAFWEKEETALRNSGRSLARRSPLALGLGDEMSLGGSEVCFGEHSLAAFRKHLRDMYPSLDRLNEVWETDFATWEGVQPWRAPQAMQRSDNLAPWLDFRVFMAKSFADAMARMADAVREGAPGVPVGGVNPIHENYVNGSFFSLVMPRLDYAQSYPRFYDWSRSWFGVPRHAWTWTGYDRSAAKIANECWMVPAYGGTMIGLYGVDREGYGSFTDTLGLGPRAQWIEEITPALTRGPGKLVLHAEMEPEPVAILKSYRSKMAFALLRGAETGEESAPGWSGEFNLYQRGYAALLGALRVGYRFVDEDQVENGELETYRALIMPQCVSLSAAALAQVRSFMALDRLVVRDDQCGRLDEHGRRRRTGLPKQVTDQAVVFPSSPPKVTPASIGALAAPLAETGITSPETFSENVGRVVRKRLGNTRILVLFGRGEMTVGLPTPTHCYDVRHHRFLGYTDSPTLLAEHGPALLAAAPYAVKGLDLEVTPAVTPGQGVTCRVTVRPAQGECGTHVVRLEVIDPAGQSRPAYAANLLAPAGRATLSFTLALSDPAGLWNVRASDVMSGRAGEAGFEVKP